MVPKRQMRQMRQASERARTTRSLLFDPSVKSYARDGFFQRMGFDLATLHSYASGEIDAPEMEARSREIKQRKQRVSRLSARPNPGFRSRALDIAKTEASGELAELIAAQDKDASTVRVGTPWMVSLDAAVNEDGDTLVEFMETESYEYGRGVAHPFRRRKGWVGPPPDAWVDSLLDSFGEAA